MDFTVLTLFPEMFSVLLAGGIVRRAIEEEYITVEPVDIYIRHPGESQTAGSGARLRLQQGSASD